MRKLTSFILLPLTASCVSVNPQQVRLANQQAVVKTLKEAQQKQEAVREKDEVNLKLNSPVPVKVLIRGICMDKGLVCDTSSVDPHIMFTNRCFKGNYSDFISFLSDRYGIKVQKVDETYFFSSTRRSNQSKLNVVVPVNVVNEPLNYFLSILSDKVGIPFKLEDVDGNLKVSYFSTDKTLKQILDELTSQFDLYWKYENGVIKVSRYERATFKLMLPFLQKDINVDGNGYELKYSRDFLNGLEDNLKKMLKDKNSEVAVTETGYVLVNARPSEVAQVKDYVEKVNSEFTKVIPLRLTIAVINLSDKYSAGVNLMNFLKYFNKTGMGNPLHYVQGKLTPDTGLTLGITEADISTVLNAFSTFGNVRVVENSLFRVLNGQPLVYNPVKKQRIVSNFELTYVPVGGGATGTTATTTQPTITTETEDLKEGSNLLIVPYSIGNGKIVVDMYRTQSQIDALTPFSVNLNGYQNQLILPTVNKSTDIQQAVLRRNESIVMLSSVIDTSKFSNKGIPGLKDIPLAGLLAGNTEGERGRIQYLIVVSYE